MVKRIPKGFAYLFPDHDQTEIDVIKHRDLILSRILERGTESQIHWALAVYTPKQIKTFLHLQGQRLLSPRTYYFWSWLWRVRPSQRQAWRRSAPFLKSAE